MMTIRRRMMVMIMMMMKLMRMEIARLSFYFFLPKIPWAVWWNRSLVGVWSSMGRRRRTTWQPLTVIKCDLDFERRKDNCHLFKTRFSRRYGVERRWKTTKYLSKTSPHKRHKMSSIAQYYISLLSGIWNIDDQYKNPNINNRDHLVGQLTYYYWPCPKYNTHLEEEKFSLKL